MHIRKSTETRIALLEAVVIFYAFAAGTMSDSPMSVLRDYPSLARLAIPTVAAAIAFLIRNAFAASEDRGAAAPWADIGLAFAAALVSQAIVKLIRPELLLSHYHFTRGAVIAWVFVAALRAWFPHRAKASRETESQRPITMEKLRWNAIELEVKTREWNSNGNLVVAAGTGLLTLSLPFAGVPRIQLAAAIFIAGAVYLAWIIRKRGSPAAAPLGGGWNAYTRYCRTELQRQSVFLHRLWHWYFGSLVPGVLLLLQGSSIYGCFGLVYVLLIAELNYRAIEHTHIEIARIDQSVNGAAQANEFV